MKRSLVVLLLYGALPACSSLPLMEPRTIGEVNANYDYIPLDPLAVAVDVGGLGEGPGAEQVGVARAEARYRRCVNRRDRDNQKNRPDLMDALPDNTVRMGVEDISGQASLSFAPVASASGEARQYRVTADSVNTDEVNVPFAIRLGEANPSASILNNAGRLPTDQRLQVFRILNAQDEARAERDHFERITIPVYVGVGLRLTAAITHRSGKLNVSSLPALTAGVEARRVTGTLAMQALGIFSQQITSLMQIPTELNAASVQQALVALGSARAVIYDADTGTRPRIVGFANPFRTNDPRLMQMIRSELARSPIVWIPCGAA